MHPENMAFTPLVALLYPAQIPLSCPIITVPIFSSVRAEGVIEEASSGLITGPASCQTPVVRWYPWCQAGHVLRGTIFWAVRSRGIRYSPSSMSLPTARTLLAGRGMESQEGRTQHFLGPKRSYSFQLANVLFFK